MIADAFKVVLEAEVDDSKLNRAGSKMGESISKSMESNMKKSRDISRSRSYRGLGGSDIASRFCECIKSHMSKRLKSGTVGENKKQDKVSGMFGLIGKKLGLNVKASSQMAESIGKQLGLTSSMIAKLAVVIAVVYLVLGFIKDLINMLAPLIGLLKLIMAVLTLTLYPIMMFFLTIFKPILYLLLKYLIIPFYQNVIPVIQKLGKWIDDTFGVGKDGPSETGQRVLDWGILGPIPGILKLIKELASKTWKAVLKSAERFFKWFGPKWEKFKVILIEKLQSTIDWVSDTWSGITDFMESPLKNIIDWVDNTWTNITGDTKNPLQDIINWVDNTWTNITGDTITPLQNIIDWVDNTWINIKEYTKNPLQKIINWVDSIWQNITGSTETPLQNIIDWVDNTWTNIKESIMNPLKSVFDFISKIKLPSWLGGGGGSSGGGSGGGGTRVPTKEEARKIIDKSRKERGESQFRAQEGAIVNHPTNVKVAERGPEIIIPLRKLERVKLPSDMSKGMTFNAPLINIQNVEKDIDIDRLVDKLERILYSNGKRSGAF